MSREEGAVLVRGFGSIVDGRSSGSSVNRDEGLLKWYCSPDSWEVCEGRQEGTGGWFRVVNKELVVAAPSKKDFWRKTYYTPTLVKDDGPCLFATLPLDRAYMVESSFTLNPKRQFDQGGICIRLSYEHWLKTGLEVVDGSPRLSCVVTNVFSDWSTQLWNDVPSIRIRVHILPHKDSYVVEASPPKKESWTFVRIAHMSTGVGFENKASADDEEASKRAWQGPSPPPGSAWAGVFACCPEDQSGSFVTFHDFSIVQGSTFQHDADGNQE